MGVILRTQHFPLKTKGQMSHCLPGKTRCYLEPIHWAHAWFEQLSLFKIHGRGGGGGRARHCPQNITSVCEILLHSSLVDLHLETWGCDGQRSSLSPFLNEGAGALGPSLQPEHQLSPNRWLPVCVTPGRQQTPG